MESKASQNPSQAKRGNDTVVRFSERPRAKLRLAAGRKRQRRSCEESPTGGSRIPGSDTPAGVRPSTEAPGLQ